jgi:hypothetical protein
MSQQMNFAEAFLVGVSTFIISFILTFAAYLDWEEWRYPGNSAQGDMALLCYPQ